jgi:iron-sulfur cluster assembly protein
VCPEFSPDTAARRHGCTVARFLNLTFEGGFYTLQYSIRTSVSKLDPKRRRKEIMITLTPEAIAKVKSILAEHKEETGLRIAVAGGGCSGFQYQMTLDKEANADDKVLDMDGLKIFVDARSILYLDGTNVDYIDGLNGSGFKFDNPNAKASCGCGESFDA